jgi:hypothetical protein
MPGDKRYHSNIHNGKYFLFEIVARWWLQWLAFRSVLPRRSEIFAEVSIPCLICLV